MPRFLLLLLLLTLPALAQVPSEPVKAGEWVKLEKCSLASGYIDGDSFKVRLPSGEEFTARLYFVDCPETDSSFPDRVKEQAQALGISVEEALSVGRRATAFTKEKLSPPFTVFTRWRSAGGRNQRFAVMIQTGQGKWLCEELVKSGLVRIFGIRTPPPPETGSRDSRAWLAQLQNLEDQAKSAKRGAWGSQP